MMYRISGLLLALLVLNAACRPREPRILMIPPLPDLAVYDGVSFCSKNGMESFDSIVIIPKTLKSPVSIICPDGTAVGINELNDDVIAKKIGFIKSMDDGRGNYNLAPPEAGLQVRIVNRKPTYIAILAPSPARRAEFECEIRGKRVHVSIKRGTLESLLGKPDEIKLKTAPG